MISTELIQAVMARYVECVSTNDVDGIVALFADDATMEDPVGKPAVSGIAAIKQFFKGMIAYQISTAHLTSPIRATLNGCGAMSFKVDMVWDGQPRSLHTIDVMEFDSEGKIRSMKAYWGPSNIVLRN